MNELDLRLIELMIELNKFHIRKIEDYNETGQANMTAEDYAILDGALDIIITTKRFDLLISFFGACSAYKSNWLYEAFDRCKKDVDHLNSDIHNNCAWNLSVMPSGCNSSKRDFAGRIKPPYFLYMAATDNGEYKIRFGYQNFAGMGQEFHLICPDESILRRFLRVVMDIDEAPCLLRRFQTPKQIWGLDKKAPYAASNFEQAAKEAERLLSMDESKFTVWDDSSIIGVGIRRG